jgi:predicted PurR-regulated permease PerM
LEQLVIKFQSWVTKNLGMSVVEQDNLMIDTGKNMLTSLGEIIKGSFSIATATIFNIVIIPLYATLFLSNRGKLVQFISSFFESNQKVRLQTILTETIRIYFNYIKGMLKVYLIVGILNSFGLWILGVDYPFLFGMATAFMTIIPYIGIMVSAMLPMSMVWIETNNYLYPLGVMGMFALVQYLEANLIFPYVVGKQLGVNMLVSICAIFLGGVLWGVSGMILFLPFVAMLRIISGHFEKLQPLFKLLKSNE